MTAFSGVLSSCDMLARKSDLCWLATCSSALLRSSSRNTRALNTASADWLANVSMNSLTSSVNSPGVFRRTTMTPMIWPPRSTGTARTDRQPSSNSSCRWTSLSTSAMSGIPIGRPSWAALPTRVSSSAMPRWRSPASSSGLLG